MLEQIQRYLYDIISGIIILLAGFGIGILSKKIIQRFLKELELNKIMSMVNINYNVERWIANIISYLIYFITVILFLDQLGIESIVLYVILGAFLMLIILTSLVGLKDIIPNFIAWVLIEKRGNLKEGRRIDIKEIYGTVERIGYLETEIKTEHGDILYVPNRLFLKSKFCLKKE
ncbi:mechanosensitive ion channel [Candidatus Woesearchaeota archaeon]|nr:mechanosensitive ion channel [Candidatus Woesearchaeota archaeon]